MTPLFADPDREGPPMTYDETVTFLEQREGKFNRHDANALAADHTDTGVVHSPIFPRVQGVVSIQSSYRALFEMFPDWHITFEAPIIDGDRAAHPFTARATTRASSWAWRARGASSRSRYAVPPRRWPDCRRAPDL